jgi:hypothetical protein
MLFDVRTYRCKPGTINRHLALYKELGMGPQTTALGGPPFAYLVAETGEINTYMHIWQYRDAADRAAKRAAMMADAGWQDYLAKSAELGALEHQQNTLMVPAPFWTPKA